MLLAGGAVSIGARKSAHFLLGFTAARVWHRGVPKPDLDPGLRDLEAKVSAFIAEGAGDFGSLLIELHWLQRRLCPAYGAYCQGFREPGSWEEIPAIPLGAFRAAPIRCFPDGETVCTFRTSGTTGEGYGEHHFHTLDLYRLAALRGWEWAGLPFGNVIGLVPPATAAPHSSLSRMASWLAPEDRFFPGDWPGLEALLARQEIPVLLFGTALSFLDLFEKLGSSHLVLPPGSLAVETGGYKGTHRTLPKSDLYALFEERLGLPLDAIWNEYGMTELSSQFYTHGLGRPHTGAPWVRALVLDPETGAPAGVGETGVLRIFDLANTGSCCAIQTRDLAIRQEGGFELLGRDPAALPRGCSRAADEMLGG